MSRILFICLSLLIFGAVTNAVVTDCGGENAIAELEEVSVEGCDDDADRCEIESGKNLNVSITFTTKALIKVACARVEAVVMGMTVSVKKGENICEDENSGVKCPLNQGLIFTYKGSVKVPKNNLFISIGKGDVLWRLVRDDEPSEKRKRREEGTPPTTEIVCVQIPVKISK